MSPRQHMLVKKIKRSSGCLMVMEAERLQCIVAIITRTS